MSFSTAVAHANSQANSLAAAETLIAKGDDQGAIAALSKVVKNSPDDYQAWFVLGVTQARSRQFDDAISSFHQVIKLQPELAEPHNNLAVIYNEKGELRAAIKELEASLELNPSYVTAHENIGDLYVKLAAESYKKALAGNDNAALSQRYERLLNIRSSETPARATASQGQPAMPAADKKPARMEIDASATAAETGSYASSSDRLSQKREALAAVENWRAAWSARDTEAYFAAYDESFGPGARFKSRKSWKKYKTGAIRNKKFITVELENIVVSAQSNGNMKVTMMQHFRSNSYKSDDLKELILTPAGAGWKIIHEKAL
ncbi:tetratricopeptide repeat protein [Mariprofundus micogutta]|nr:tetratricopeptide repeat protein [Mariprofundus micogutta]